MTIARPRPRFRWLTGTAVSLLTVAALGGCGAGDPEPAEPTTASGSPESGAPAPSTDDEFGPGPGLCEDTDQFAPVFDIVPLAEVADDTELGDVEEGTYQRACLFRLADDVSLGHLIVHVGIYGAPGDAGDGFRDRLAPAESLLEAREELAGDWEEGAVLRGGSSTDATVQLIARDGVMTVDVTCSVTGDAHDAGAQREAVLRVAGNVREAMRR